MSLPLPFAHCQTHYLISLAALHSDRSLSELKANLQRHTASENCDEKAKSNDVNFEIWSKMPLLVGCNRLKAQRILLMIHHTVAFYASTTGKPTLYMYMAYSHTYIHLDIFAYKNHFSAILKMQCYGLRDL